MFDHKHYVPILKGKEGEFAALAHLKSRQPFTPLVEVVPASGKKGTLEKRFKTTILKLVNGWGRADPLFLDLVFIETDEMTPGGRVHPVTAFFDTARSAALKAIPVT